MNTVSNAPFTILMHAHPSQRHRVDRDYLVGLGFNASVSTKALRNEFSLGCRVLHAGVGSVTVHNIIEPGPLITVYDSIPVLHSIVGITINDPDWLAGYIERLQDPNELENKYRPQLHSAFAEFLLHHASED